jgi:hypothetical protein
MKVIYKSLEDFLNNHPIYVIKPNYINPLPIVVQEGKVPVDVLHINQHLEGYGYLTVNEMLDLFSKDINFTILNDDDLYLIWKYLKKYLEDLNEALIDSPDNKAFNNPDIDIRLMQRFYMNIEKEFYKICKTNPKYKHFLQNEKISAIKKYLKK